MKCVVFLLTLLVHTAIGTNSLDTAFEDNLCLNGSRDSEVNSPDVHTASAGPAKSSRSCPTGYTDHQDQSVPKTCSGALCDRSCPPGYVLIKGICEIQNPTCPSGSYFKNGFCYYQPVPPHTLTATPIEKIEIVPPLKVNIPVPKLIDPLDSNDVDPNEDDDGDIEVVPDRRPHPGENVVHNVNTVHSPTNVTSSNVNNVSIHITRHKSDGSIKAVIIRNNETTVYEEKSPAKQEGEDQEMEPVIMEQSQQEKWDKVNGTLNDYDVP